MKAAHEAVFAQHLKAKLEKSNALGTKASWSTEDHLKAVADCLAPAQPEDFYEILKDVYNISGFQQRIAKTFAASGHFQREGKARAQTAEDLIAQLAQDAERE